MKTTKNNFEDLISPPPVEFSYDTIGWKVVGIVVVLLAIFLFVLVIRRYNRNRYRREALRLISKLHTRGHERLIQIDKILRRTAYTAYKDPHIKCMDYDKWGLFLLDTSPQYSDETEFLSHLTELVYQQYNEKNDILISKYEAYARFWIRKHEF